MKCDDCDATHVVQTKRSFKIRKSEHVSNKNSVIHQHLHNEKYNFNCKNFRIIDNEKNRAKRDISERDKTHDSSL